MFIYVVRAKVKTLWEDGIKVATGNVKIEFKEKFIMKLDKLFDILSCHCTMKKCTELAVACSSSCAKNIHIECNCSREHKIPVQELNFICGQREKIGSVGPHQMGLTDHRETRRQEKAQERRDLRQKAAE